MRELVARRSMGGGVRRCVGGNGEQHIAGMRPQRQREANCQGVKQENDSPCRLEVIRWSRFWTAAEEMGVIEVAAIPLQRLLPLRKKS